MRGRVRVLGEFPTADDETVIPLELVFICGRTECVLALLLSMWGVDVARFGDDRTALAKRTTKSPTGAHQRWSSIEPRWQRLEGSKSGAEETSYDMRPREILIDAIHLGAGVYDRCRELGLPVKSD